MQRIPRPSKRVTMAEGEGEISEQENLILGQIRNYFDLPFSRHFHKFDENELANRILWIIANEKDLPTDLNIYYFSDPTLLNPDHPGPIPREDVDTFLVAVGNHIQQRKADDFDWQVARRKAEVQRKKLEYQVPKRKVHKIRRRRVRT